MFLLFLLTGGGWTGGCVDELSSGQVNGWTGGRWTVGRADSGRVDEFPSVEAWVESHFQTLK